MEWNGNEIVLRPSDIRYTQNTISNKFKNGTLIGRLLDDVVTGTTLVSKVKKIGVQFVDGMWYSADCRRLWVFKQLEFLGYCPLITANVVKQIQLADCTSDSGGTNVTIQGGQPGGIWYSKVEEIRQKLKTEVSALKEQDEKIGLPTSKLCSSKIIYSYHLQSSKCPVFDASHYGACGSSSKFQVDSDGISKHGKRQVETLSKAKAEGRNKHVPAEFVSIVDKTSAISMNDTSKTAHSHAYDMLPRRIGGVVNYKPIVNTRMNKQRHKKKAQQKKNFKPGKKQTKLQPYLPEVQNDSQDSARLKTKELFVFQRKIETSGHMSPIELKTIETNLNVDLPIEHISATADNEDDEVVDNDELNFNTNGAKDDFGDRSNVTVAGHDDSCSYPYNVWSYDEYYGIGLPDKTGGKSDRSAEHSQRC